TLAYRLGWPLRSNGRHGEHGLTLHAAGGPARVRAHRRGPERGLYCGTPSLSGSAERRAHSDDRGTAFQGARAAVVRALVVALWHGQRQVFSRTVHARTAGDPTLAGPLRALGHGAMVLHPTEDTWQLSA